MEKKKYFIFESVLCVIISIVSLFNIEASREAALKTVSQISGVFGERMVKVYSSNAIFIFPAVLCILFGFIIFMIVYKDKLSIRRNLVLALSIFMFLFSSNNYISLLSIINIIICLSIKVDKERGYKQSIPVLSRYSSGYKGIIGALGCFLIFYSQLFIPKLNSYIFSIFIYFIVLGLLIFIFKDNLKRDVVVFKRNYKSYISYILPRLGFMYLIYFGTSIVCTLVNKDISVNQQQINALPMWYTFPLASFLAPIVEEILFRGCIRRFLKNDTLFVIVSGILFGLLHTISEGSVIGAIVMCIPYATLGCGFAYIYAKTNNLTNTILCHSLHNTVVCLLQIILF